MYARVDFVRLAAFSLFLPHRCILPSSLLNDPFVVRALEVVASNSIRCASVPTAPGRGLVGEGNALDGSARAPSGEDDTHSSDEDHTDSSDDDSLPPSYSHIDRAGRDIAIPGVTEPFSSQVVPCKLKVLVIIIYIIFIAICLGLPLALTVVGFIHYDDCPRQPRIPLWMIVMGMTVMVSCIIRNRVASILLSYYPTACA